MIHLMKVVPKILILLFRDKQVDMEYLLETLPVSIYPLLLYSIVCKKCNWNECRLSIQFISSSHIIVADSMVSSTLSDFSSISIDNEMKLRRHALTLGYDRNEVEKALGELGSEVTQVRRMIYSSQTRIFI